MRPPANPEHYLRRPRLLQRLDDSARAPITLVVAPAGSGKTSLLVDWCAVSTIPTGWVSLDETDRDGSQLWSSVAAALTEIMGGVPWHPKPSLRLGSLTEAAASVLTYLEGEHPRRAVLVIDDLQLVDDDESIAASVGLFLTSLPPWLHVVLLSRRTPKLPIDRLRGRGQLRDLPFAELRFSVGEAEGMVNRLAPSLTEEAVSAAVGRACGWAAGLQLTALAARSERSLGGLGPPPGETDLLLSDYVWHEVLSAERPELVEVLLQTAIVNRANPALAAALTGRPDAGDLLLEAESRGLFIARLGRSGWLEMHALVRDELEAEALRRSPGGVAELHARAAQWFEDAGELASALEHWLSAGRFRDALRLLALHVGELYDSGREATIARTIRRIPLNVSAADPQTMVELAWCHLLVDKDRFLETVERAAAMVGRTSGPARDLVGRLRLLEAVAATVTGDWPRSGGLVADAMDALGEVSASDPLGRFGWNVVAREVALSESWDDRAPRLEEARQGLSSDAERRLAFEGIRALGEALAGHPVDALRIAAGVRDIDAVSSMTIIRAELGIAQAIAHRELGDRPQAVAELTALAGSSQWPVTHAQVLALLELTELRVDEGDLAAADRTFERAHELVRSDFPGAAGVSRLARTGTIVALAGGQAEVARSWAGQVGDTFWGAISAAGVHLFEGSVADAVAVLDEVVPRCSRHDVVLALMRARAAQSRQGALGDVARAIEIAAGTGLLQTVASVGAPLLDLLEVHASMAPSTWFDRLRRAVPRPAGGTFADPSLPGEHLTDREVEVLRLLPTRLTQREIAGELFISINTLKFHLRVIYRKLGVGSRAEAADVARQMAAIRRSKHGSREIAR